MYWVMLPMAFILALSIIYTPYATGWLKLYPLMLVSAGGIVFMFIFYFRLIRINWTEVKDIGRFSPRDSAVINEGKSLVLVPQRGGRVKVYLYGKDGLPELDWMRDQTTDPSVICMYRGRTQGGKRAVRRVLRYFGASDADVKAILSEVGTERVYENATLLSREGLDGRIEYVINITATV